MNLLKISLKNILNKKLNSFLSVLLLAMAICIISLLVHLREQFIGQFTKNIKGIDMVLGAKGSPLQLILAGVYHIDAPTGNISLSEAQVFMHSPQVKNAIPISMGDSYQGYHILGTTEKYAQLFEAELLSGSYPKKSMEVVVGFELAHRLGIKNGSTFLGSHGLSNESITQHSQNPYKVVGIFRENKSVLDKLILTPLESVWEVHSNHHNETKPREITSMLVKFRNPAMGMMLARNINQNSNMQAALLAIEVNRLLSLLGGGIEMLQYLAYIIMAVAAISIFISLYNSLKERKYELAIMLSMGATRTQLFLLLLFEGLLLSLVGFGIGVMFSRIALWLVTSNLDQHFYTGSLDIPALLPEEWFLLGIVLYIGIVAAALPSSKVYRMNISATLAEN